MPDTRNPKGEFIRFVLFLFSVLTLFSASYSHAALTSGTIPLTSEERAWLDNNPGKLVLWYDAHYPPVEYQSDDGAFSGLTQEIVRLIEQRLGVRFAKKPATFWPQLLRDLEKGDAPIVSCITSTPDREKYAFFTAPYMTIPAMVITTKSRPEVAGLEDFRGLRVAAVAGYVTERYLLERYQGVFDIVPVPSVQDGLRKVSFGLVDAMLENLAVAVYFIDKETLPNLRVAASTDLFYKFSIAVSRKYPLLFSAVQKAQDDIPPETLELLLKRFVPLDKSQFLTLRMRRLLETTFLFIVSLLLGLGIISWFLKRRLKKKEDSLRAAMIALEEKDSRLQLAMMATKAAIWDLYPQTGEAHFSAEWYAMLGYAPGETPENLAGWTALTHPDDRDALQAHLQAYLDAGGTEDFEVEFRLRTKTGQWLWILGKGQSVAWNAEGTPTRLIGMNIDIQRPKTAQEALRASEEKFSRLFQFSPDAIALLKLQGGAWFLDVNDSFTTLFGYPMEALYGKSVADVNLIRDPHHLNILHDTLRQGQPVMNLEVEAFGREDKAVYCSLSCQQLDLDGQPYVLAVFRDITENKRMQEMMVQTEKMLSVGGIAAGIAHEINNPLAIVLQSAQNMEQRCRPDTARNKEIATAIGLDLALFDQYMKARKVDVFIQNIQSAARRASDIIRHMLRFSRRSDSRHKECDLRTIIDRAVDLAGIDFDLKKSYDFKKISIQIRSDDDLPGIKCSETEIEQVLLNLLRNAAQAIAEAAPAIDAPRIDITLSTLDGWLRMEVADNGPGMSEEVQKRSLEPFFTTKEQGEGTGLGLSVSYFIVTTGHGGTFKIASHSGEGTAFIIELPLTDRPTIG